MFIAIIIIILGACASILGSVYYNTIALQKSYGTVNGYYGAYYGAMSSIERGLLMSKLKYPKYVGSGGFKGDEIYGAASNGFSGDFWKLNQGNNSLTRSVNSQTTHISGTIDTKTIRAISFYNYNDDSTIGYTTGNQAGSSGIRENLSFSGTADSLQHNGTGVDFNRFFGLNNSGRTVRGLLTTQYENYDEKDAPLSGDFVFQNNSCNPRPASSGQHQQGNDQCN